MLGKELKDSERGSQKLYMFAWYFAYKAICIEFLIEFEHQFLKMSGVCQSSLTLC